ncbi:MAG: response regulator transcription factor [Akkermansiaceae bacterium]|nr:response regulator transcription factor [Akkermansiaceae bacterium]
MRVLIIEDDVKTASFIAKGFKEAGMVVDTAHDGIDGLDLLMTRKYDAAVLDLMLPELDGLSLLGRARAARVKTPVIILSAKRSVNERIEGLKRGGDDYLVKPFAFSELLARVQAITRRSGDTQTDHAEKLRVADLELDPWKREASRAGETIPLHAREFVLLEHLMRNQGRVVSKTSILENVYEYHFDPQTNVVDVLMCRLRAKIDKDYSPKLIHTVRGMGYVLRPES